MNAMVVSTKLQCASIKNNSKYVQNYQFNISQARHVGASLRKMTKTTDYESLNNIVKYQL